MRWKPSTRSRSLSRIFSLEHPHRPALARIVACSVDHGPTAREPVSPFQSARGYSLWGRLPNVHRRDGLCHRPLPGGLKGRGSLAATIGSGVACAGPIRASAVRCCCSSENIPRSDRQRPEGFQRSRTSAVLSAVEAFLTAPTPETTDNYASNPPGRLALATPRPASGRPGWGRRCRCR